MSSFLTLASVSAATPEGHCLFRDLTISVGTERVGVVGRNGSGKSTLLRIIAGLSEPTAGTILCSGSTGTLVQSWKEDSTVAQALGIADAQAAIDRITSGMGSEEDFDAADWSLEARVKAALTDAGLSGVALGRIMGTLSGGERTRVGVARLLIEAPDLLLLDEPTNNLDAPGRSAIRAMIENWRGGVLMASHDRHLLESMDRIVELTPVGVHVAGGGWSAFAQAREAERVRAASELDRSDAQLREARRALQRQREAKDRRDKAGRAFATRGSEPKIVLDAMAERAENSGGRSRHVGERLISDAVMKAEEARAKVESLTPLTIALPSTALPSGADLLDLNAVVVVAGNRRLGPWTLHVRGPERIGIIGPNGAGKTTLLKVAAGAIKPSSGTVRRAAGRIAMLDQHVGFLDARTSILTNFRRLNPTLDEREAHAACARFAFRNRDALRTVGTLSGGERLRAALACIFSGDRSPWLLLLDEPTNHLDVDSVEILEAALMDFDGAIVVVSHDQAFLNAVGVEREFAMAK